MDINEHGRLYYHQKLQSPSLPGPCLKELFRCTGYFAGRHERCWVVRRSTLTACWLVGSARSFSKISSFKVKSARHLAGLDPRGRSSPLKAYESNLFHHDFAQCGKQHSRCKVILPSIILSQQCCEVYFVSYSSELVMRLQNITEKILLKSHPIDLLAGSAPVSSPFWKWILHSTSCLAYRLMHK